MGTWVRACPANATSPMRSDLRARTNSIAVCFATSMRFAGAKSSACMLPEISTASTMEMPSLRISLCAAPTRGPAAATIHAPGQALLRVEAVMGGGDRLRQRGPHAPDGTGGNGFGLSGGEPAGVGDLTFQWNLRCRFENAGPPASLRDPRDQQPDRHRRGDQGRYRS